MYGVFPWCCVLCFHWLFLVCPIHSWLGFYHLEILQFFFSCSHFSFHHATGGLSFISKVVLGIVFSVASSMLLASSIDSWFRILVIILFLWNCVKFAHYMLHLCCFPFFPLRWSRSDHYLLGHIPCSNSFLELMICLEVFSQLLICSHHKFCSMFFFLFHSSTRCWIYLCMLVSNCSVYPTSKSPMNIRYCSLFISGNIGE